MLLCDIFCQSNNARCVHVAAGIWGWAPIGPCNTYSGCHIHHLCQRAPVKVGLLQERQPTRLPRQREQPNRGRVFFDVGAFIDIAFVAFTTSIAFVTFATFIAFVTFTPFTAFMGQAVFWQWLEPLHVSLLMQASSECTRRLLRSFPIVQPRRPHRPPLVVRAVQPHRSQRQLRPR